MTFEEFVQVVATRYLVEPDWRWGQTIFNVISEVRPDLAEQIRNTPHDPFFDDAQVRGTLKWIRWQMDASP